jgi:hypothetical protein
VIKTISYLEIPLEIRQRAANQAREQLRAALANPFLAQEQRDVLSHQLNRLDHWERGSLAVGSSVFSPVEPIE